VVATDGEAIDDSLRTVGIEAMPAEWVEAVIELGDKHRNRLGPMPYSGFRQAASAGHIVLAIRVHHESTDDTNGIKGSGRVTPGTETLAGYCLYAPTVRSDRYARIAHLCIASDERGNGIARLLIDSVMDRCDDRLGLRLRCRDDWEAADAWPALGFEPVRRRSGRGKKRSPMTEWYLPNATAHLLSLPAEDPDQLLTAVDSNVFCDLYGTSPTRRQRFSGTVALLAASEQIRLARPFTLTSELNKTSDQHERDVLLHSAAVGGLPVLNGDRNQIRKLRDKLLAGVPEAVATKDESLKADATLLAEAILGGADVFVTRDTNIVTYLWPAAAEDHDFAVLYPDELPAFIDRRADASSYLPGRLEETQYQITRGDATTWNPELLMDLLSKEVGEKKVEFRARVKAVAKETASGGERLAMLTPSGEVLATWSSRKHNDRLEILLLRIESGDLLPTIARQVSRYLRRKAAESGATTVVVLDPYVPKTVLGELQRDGFTPDTSGNPTAVVLTTVGPWAKVRAAAVAIVGTGLILPDVLTSTAQASEFERVLWPAKILDPDLPSYIVPIRGVFADDLLGHVPTLFARPADLGLSREHVYYRSGQSRPAAPGRVLWYSSARDQAVVACSRLVESVTATPEVLHREFANIGVLSLEQVRAVRDKRKGTVTALRFADTEIFTRPVPLRRVNQLSKGAAKLTIQSPVPVDPQWFKRLYEEGKPR
jgi:GNAT superfamily N-acetyltransferase